MLYLPPGHAPTKKAAPKDDFFKVSDCYDLNYWERLVLWSDGIRESAVEALDLTAKSPPLPSPPNKKGLPGKPDKPFALRTQPGALSAIG